ADPSRGTTTLVPTRGEVNEGMVPAHLVPGRLGEWRLYLPLVFRQYPGLQGRWREAGSVDGPMNVSR
ncbi:MAG: hypothetical protein ACPLYD_15965, partial [Anaerolineae bacterium]